VGVTGPLRVEVSEHDAPLVLALLEHSKDMILATADPKFRRLLLGDESAYDRLDEVLQKIMREELHTWNDWANRGLEIKVLVQNFDEPLRLLSAAANEYRVLLDASRRSAVPRSFYWSLVLFAFLALVGVIWPLSQLDARTDQDKILMLVALGIGLAGLLLFLWLQLRVVLDALRITPDAVDHEPIA
jgi:hypothetical protein